MVSGVKDPCGLGRRTFLLAPLRVDAIIGTPLISWVENLSFFKDNDQLGLVLKKEGVEHVLLVRPTNRQRHVPTCNAAHLQQFRGRPLRAAVKEAAATGVTTVRRFSKMPRKKLFVDMFSIHICPVDPSTAPGMVDEVTGDVLAGIPAEHLLRDVLEKYRTTLFTEQTT
ncbi:hypothetical protein HDU90_001839, partial [Geranomyces variabilis]